MKLLTPGCPVSLCCRGRGAGHPINFASLVIEAVPPDVLNSGESIEIWFGDEARVGQKGTQAYV